MPKSHNEPIGFVGLGIMGFPMSSHLARAGVPLTVYDLDPGRAARVAAGHPNVSVADSPAAAGSGAGIVITMLPDGHVVRDVVGRPGGDNGLISSMAPGSIVIDTSSSQPWLTVETAARLGERGISMIDAPVSGAQWGAEAAELVFMAGGAVDDLERVRPILDLLGRAVFHVGPLGSGHIMKSINNTITAMTLVATAEGLALGAKAGLDPAAMNAVLNESTGGSWITANHIDKRILTRTFDDPFKLDLMSKDVAIANRLARDLELPLPLAALCEAIYGAARLDAGAGASLSEVVRWVEKTTHSEIRAAGGKR
jgi:3-hydroxyisobutyrate dehydrogenase